MDKLDAGLFWIRIDQSFAWVLISSELMQPHGIAERPGDDANFRLKVLIFIKRLMRRGIGFHVAHISIGFSVSTGRCQRHFGEPIDQRASQRFGTHAVAMRDAEMPPGQMPWVGPALPTQRSLEQSIMALNWEALADQIDDDNSQATEARLVALFAGLFRRP